ncbi:MAG: cobaltochelatase subunit CobN [Acidobacteriota bacterium]
MKITIFYVGTSLIAPLKRAEEEINRQYDFNLEVSAHNCGAAMASDEWARAEMDVSDSEIVFIIHVTDQENASRICHAIDSNRERLRAVIAFNCMPDLMRRTRMGKLDFAALMKSREAGEKENEGRSLARKVGSWMAETIRGRREKNGQRDLGQYVKLISKMPVILRFVPATGRLGDIKNYLFLFCYFLQPSPANIRSMLLYAIKHYGDVKAPMEIDAPEQRPVVGIYHPDADKIFDSFDAYRKWLERRQKRKFDPNRAIGLLLMRPQIISESRRHYDGLIRAIERENFSVIPAISTFMDNRDACREFFIEEGKPRVSQIVSLTGFSFVGGPAMNDSEASVEFFKAIDVGFRSLVSLDVQTIENWQQSRTGLNPVQSAMQVAIPEIDGAIEPFVFGGLSQKGVQPEPIEDRCQRIARRLARWNHLQTAPRSEMKLAIVIFCFPPNKGNIGTAADLDVFPSLMEILARLKSEGYTVTVPASADELRALVLEGNSEEAGQVANVAHRMSVDEYRRLCPYVSDIEREWGSAPGLINANGRELFLLGAHLGNVFICVQPTFGYEGDPMRMLAAESATPHHGFMAAYTYIEKVFCADAVIHTGTHGALEFMPGKQAGLSSSCWPDRLISELPNIYLYSVNNPSEGTIARRRSSAELISYLTPPIANAGLHRQLAEMKELLAAYRRTTDDTERDELYEAIEEKAKELNLT